VGAAATLGSVLLMPRIGRALGWSAWLSLAPAALLAAHGWSARWAISGMETPLALFLVVASLHALARTLQHGATAWPAGILLGLTVLARPECWILLALALLAVGIGAGARRARGWTGIAGGAALVLVPWLALAWTWFRRLTPNTSAAKAGLLFDPALAASALQASIRALLATDALAIGFAVIALATAGPRLFRIDSPPRRAFWTVVFLWPLLLVLGYAVGGVQVVSRYLVPAVPSILLLGTAAAYWIAPQALPAGRKITGKAAVVGAPGARAYVTAALVLVACVQNVRSPRGSRRRTRGATRRGSSHRSARSECGRGPRPHPGHPSRSPTSAPSGSIPTGRCSTSSASSPRRWRRSPCARGTTRSWAVSFFERIGRPEYLIDRARTPGRLADPEDPSDPYRFLRAVEIPDLGITRATTYVYSLYTIDWSIYDQMHPRLASQALDFRNVPRYAEGRLDALTGTRGGGDTRIGQSTLPSQAPLSF
jgi:hypothetical protein